MSRSLRRFLPRLACVAGLALSPSIAAGQSAPLTFTPCPTLSEIGCSTLSVPVDRAAPTGARLSLTVHRIPARGTPKGTLLALAGGPGEAAATKAGGLERLMAELAPDYDVVVFNQRGTGDTALECRAFEVRQDLARAAAQCADQIGPQRVFFTTNDSVADIEDLRVALGAPTLTLAGVSYGTLVAQAYARTHPTRVARMVLDSVVPRTGVDIRQTDAHAAARRILREMCARNACRGVTSDLAGDVAAVERRLQVRGIPGVRVDENGRARRGVFGGPSRPEALFDLFTVGDALPALRQALPAALRSARQGDASALMRLAITEPTGASGDQISVALLSATLCGESALPWNASMTGPQRLAARDAFFAATPARDAAPFRRPGGTSLYSRLCILWPNAAAETLPTAPLPDVPVLLLSGSADTRTPIEWAQRVAAELPRAQSLVAVNAGHSILPRGSRCVAAAVRRFLADGNGAGRCVTPVGPPRRVAVMPTRFSDVRPLPGVPVKVGRTLQAVRLTLADVNTAITFGTPAGQQRLRVTGLRGGRGFVTITRAELQLTMEKMSGVPGVTVSGVARTRLSNRDRRYRLTVGGSQASRGVLVVQGTRARGVLDGVPFSIPFPRYRNG